MDIANALPDISGSDSERLQEFVRVTTREVKAVGGASAGTTLDMIGYIRELEHALATRRASAPPGDANTGLHCNGCGLLIEGWPNVFRCVTPGCGRIYHEKCLLAHCASDRLCPNCKEPYVPYELRCDKCGTKAFDCCLSKPCKQCGGTIIVTSSPVTPSTTQAGEVSAAPVVKDDVLNNWLKPMCHRLQYGKCTTLYCLRRGGYTGEPADASIATCEAYEAYNALAAQLTVPSLIPEGERCWHECDYGGMRCVLPKGHSGTHDYTSGPPLAAAPVAAPVGDADERLLTPEELANIERFQRQRRRNPVAADAWLYVAEIDRLLTHIRLEREQLENEIFQDATDPAFAARSDAARRAAVEIRDWLGLMGGVDGEAINEIAAIISKHCQPATAAQNFIDAFRDTAIKCHIGFKHEGPWEECKWIECEDRRRMIKEACAPADNDAEGE